MYFRLQVVKKGRGEETPIVKRKEKTLNRQSAIEEGLRQRPQSLTHTSLGSTQGFSLFGSVDSEQSVPRTAPLATPEQVK